MLIVSITALVIVLLIVLGLYNFISKTGIWKKFPKCSKTTNKKTGEDFCVYTTIDKSVVLGIYKKNKGGSYEEMSLEGN